jgi:hypothetical protein
MIEIDRIVRPGAFELDAESIRSFETAGDIAAKSVFRSGAEVDVLELRPSTSQSKIPAISCLCDGRCSEAEKRCARKRCRSEFHF